MLNTNNKTKTVILREREVQHFNEKFDANVSVNCQEVSFVVPKDIPIDERTVEMLIATNAGMITKETLVSEIDTETPVENLIGKAKQ